jgi:hypothetical protein
LFAHGKKPTVFPLYTEEGGPLLENGPPDVGYLVMIRLAATAIWALAAAYVASEYEDTVDRALKRNETGSRLLAAQASMVDVVHAHAEQEHQAGQSLFYSAEEKAVLDELLAQQKLFAAVPEGPKDPVKPPGPLGNLGTGLGSGLGIGIVVVGAILLVMNSRKG